MTDLSASRTRIPAVCLAPLPALLSQPAPWHVPLEPYQQPSGHPQTEYRRAGAAAPPQKTTGAAAAPTRRQPRRLLDAIAATRRRHPREQGAKNRQPYPAPGKGDLEIYM